MLSATPSNRLPALPPEEGKAEPSEHLVAPPAAAASLRRIPHKKKEKKTDPNQEANAPPLEEGPRPVLLPFPQSLFLLAETPIRDEKQQTDNDPSELSEGNYLVKNEVTGQSASLKIEPLGVPSKAILPFVLHRAPLRVSPSLPNVRYWDDADFLIQKSPSLSKCSLEYFYVNAEGPKLTSFQSVFSVDDAEVLGPVIGPSTRMARLSLDDNKDPRITSILCSIDLPPEAPKKQTLIGFSGAYSTSSGIIALDPIYLLRTVELEHDEPVSKLKSTLQLPVFSDISPLTAVGVSDLALGPPVAPPSSALRGLTYTWHVAPPRKTVSHGYHASLLTIGSNPSTLYVSLSVDLLKQQGSLSIIPSKGATPLVLSFCVDATVQLNGAQFAVVFRATSDGSSIWLELYVLCSPSDDELSLVLGQPESDRLAAAALNEDLDMAKPSPPAVPVCLVDGLPSGLLPLLDAAPWSCSSLLGKVEHGAMWRSPLTALQVANIPQYLSALDDAVLAVPWHQNLEEEKEEDVQDDEDKLASLDVCYFLLLSCYSVHFSLSQPSFHFSFSLIPFLFVVVCWFLGS